MLDGVAQQVVAAGRFAGRLEQRLGGRRVAGHRLGPRARGERLGAQRARRRGGRVEDRERAARGLEDAAGLTHRAARGVRAPQPRPGEQGRIARAFERRGRAVEGVAGGRAVPAPGLGLGEVGQEHTVLRRDAGRLGQERRRLVERADAPGVPRGAPQLADRLAVAPREPQVTGDLGRAVGVVAVLREGVGQPLVQPRAVRLGQVGVRRVAQQRVPVGEPAAGGGENAGLHGRGRRARRLGDGQAVDLAAFEAAPGRGDELGQQSRLGRQRRERRAHGAAQARRRLALAAGQRPRGLDREQRVALGRVDDPRDVSGAERGDRPGEPRDGVGAERLELDRGAQRAAGAERLLDGIDLRAGRLRAAGEQQEHGQAGGTAPGVGQQLETRGVREVDVLERERDRPVAGRPLDELDGRLLQPRALEVGRRAGALAVAGAEAPAEPRRERRKARGPPGVGRRRREVARQLADQLRPEPERRAAALAVRPAGVERRARGRERPAGAGAVEQLVDEAGLADAGLAGDRDDAAAPVARGRPDVEQHPQLAFAPDERERGLGRGSRRADRGGRRALRRGLLGAHLVEDRPRRRRGRDAQLAAQALGEPVVHADRRRALPRRGQPAHQTTVRRLVEAVERGLAACPRERRLGVAAGLGLPREPLEHGPEALAMRRPRLDGPVVVEALEQVAAAAQRDRLLEAARGAELLEGERVDPDRAPAVEADPVGVGGERAGGRPQRPPQRPDRSPQARPCARVEHVGPEARGQVRTRV